MSFLMASKYLAILLAKTKFACYKQVMVYIHVYARLQSNHIVSQWLNNAWVALVLISYMN